MATMKVYAGWRDPDGTVHVTVHRRPLRHVRYYNPDGFDWGNDSSGAADLALSMLANHFGERHVNGAYLQHMRPGKPVPKCWQYHQAFTTDVIATLSSIERWLVTSEQIALWLELQANR
jgi:hypothetical protein